MRRIGDRQFLYAWQVIRAATQPGHEAMSWSIEGAHCRRYRHSLGCPDHALSFDVYHVGRGEGRGGWEVMICSENWWDDRKATIRSQLWATHLSGARDQIMAWFRDAAARLEKRG